MALSPGVGFGPGGDGYVRFALIENEQRIGQAVRNLQAGPAEAGLTAASAALRRRQEAVEAEGDGGVGDLVGGRRRGRG